MPPFLSGETKQLGVWCNTARVGVKRFELLIGKIMKPARNIKYRQGEIENTKRHWI